MALVENISGGGCIATGDDVQIQTESVTRHDIYETRFFKFQRERLGEFGSPGGIS